MDEQQLQPTTPQPSKKLRPVPVASIHTHFNINRNVHEAHEGPVTLDEQIKAVTRHVRWHERQVHVGKQLLGQLIVQQDKAREQEDAASQPRLS